MIELKPCPFCGNTAFVSEYLYDPYITFFVECNGCHATTFEFATSAEAIEAWNRRVSE